MLTILITGDNMMNPGMFKAAIEKEFGADRFDIRIKKYNFSKTDFQLERETTIPSGMCFEDPKVKMAYEDCGVSEYYGEPYSLIDDIVGVDILVIHGAALPRKVLERADRLKYIISLRGGPANVDVACAKERGIRFFNTNGKNAQAVAEFTLGAILDFERGISVGSTKLLRDIWWIKGADTYDSHELQRKSFGFVGYGRIAQALRRLLSAFDIEAYTYSPHISDEVLERDNVKRLSLESLVSGCDYVTLHSRSVSGEPPVMSADMIARMHADSVLINSGRGSLLDYKALKKALEERKIRGAILDVLGPEPFGFYKEMLSLDNVLITPHIAGQSHETCQRACEMSVSLLNDILELERDREREETRP